MLGFWVETVADRCQLVTELKIERTSTLQFRCYQHLGAVLHSVMVVLRKDLRKPTSDIVFLGGIGHISCKTDV